MEQEIVANRVRLCKLGALVGFLCCLVVNVLIVRLSAYGLTKKTRRDFGWLVPLGLLLAMCAVVNLLHMAGHSHLDGETKLNLVICLAGTVLVAVASVRGLRAALRDRTEQ